MSLSAGSAVDGAVADGCPRGTPPAPLPLLHSNPFYLHSHPFLRPPVGDLGVDRHLYTWSSPRMDELAVDAGLTTTVFVSGVGFMGTRYVSSSMAWHRLVIALGVGGTVLLLTAVVGFEAIGGDFPSVFYVLPIALLTAGAALAGTYVALGRAIDRRVASALAGVAALAYVVLLLQAVRYAIAATRSSLPVDTIALLALAVAIVVAGASWYYDAVPGGG